MLWLSQVSDKMGIEAVHDADWYQVSHFMIFTLISLITASMKSFGLTYPI